MAGRRKRGRAKLEVDSPTKTSPPSCGSSGVSSDGISQRKIPLLKQPPKEEEEVAAVPRKTPDTRVLQRRLLSLIRVYYLDAISRLPTADLRTTLARGVLFAGHCYGPLSPVHNILLNSIWYDAAFPLRSTDRIDVDVITAEGISRAVQRSLDGLVASLRHYCPGLSHDDTLWHLNLCRADLRAAVASARGGAPCCPSESEARAAFQAAARAARHPKPAAFALYVSSVIPSVEREAISLLTDMGRLSSPDVLRLSTMLLPSPLPDELPQPPREWSPKVFRIVALKRKIATKFFGALLEIADAALHRYAQQTGAHYQLHTVYGETIMDDELDRYFHINFMAWPKDPSPASEAPLFFFAEAFAPPRPDFHEEDINLCYTVQPSPSDVDDCRACLIFNHKIDHPGVDGHFGGKHYKTDDIDDHHWGCPSTDEFRFFDPDRDIDFLEYMHDEIARIDAIHTMYTKLSDEDTLLSDEDDIDEDTMLRDEDEDIYGYCIRLV